LISTCKECDEKGWQGKARPTFGERRFFVNKKKADEKEKFPHMKKVGYFQKNSLTFYDLYF